MKDRGRPSEVIGSMGHSENIIAVPGVGYRMASGRHLLHYLQSAAEEANKLGAADMYLELLDMITDAEENMA